ncbi:MAG: YqzL family protein [Velocimicrobium sp.]
MEDVKYWNVFEQTGSVDAYLLYACACERTEQTSSREGEQKHESRKYYGNGTFCHTSRGLR